MADKIYSSRVVLTPSITAYASMMANITTSLASLSPLKNAALLAAYARMVSTITSAVPLFIDPVNVSYNQDAEVPDTATTNEYNSEGPIPRPATMVINGYITADLSDSKALNIIRTTTNLTVTEGAKGGTDMVTYIPAYLRFQHNQIETWLQYGLPLIVKDNLGRYAIWWIRDYNIQYDATMTRSALVQITLHQQNLISDNLSVAALADILLVTTLSIASAAISLTSGIASLLTNTGLEGKLNRAWNNLTDYAIYLWDISLGKLWGKYGPLLWPVGSWSEKKPGTDIPNEDTQPGNAGTITVVQGDNCAYITYPAVTNADKYMILQGSTVYATPVTLYCRLTVAGSYSYYGHNDVSGLNGKTSAAVAVTIARSTVAPAAITQLTILPYDGYAIISWDAITDSASFNVIVSPDPDIKEAIINYNTAELSYTVTGLENGRKYWAWVQPTNSVGTPDYSSVSGTEFIPNVAEVAEAAPETTAQKNADGTYATAADLRADYSYLPMGTAAVLWETSLLLNNNGFTIDDLYSMENIEGLIESEPTILQVEDTEITLDKILRYLELHKFCDVVKGLFLDSEMDPNIIESQYIATGDAVPALQEATPTGDILEYFERQVTLGNGNVYNVKFVWDNYAEVYMFSVTRLVDNRKRVGILSWNVRFFLQDEFQFLFFDLRAPNGDTTAEFNNRVRYGDIQYGSILVEERKTT